MPSVIQHSLSLYRQLGLKDFSNHIARKTFDRFRSGESFRFLLLELTQLKPLPASSENSLASLDTFRFASAEDLRELSKDPASNLVERDLVSFERGSRCLLQMRGSALVGYCWLNYDPLIELKWGIHFNMPDDMAYNFNSFTLPAYRGTGYQSMRHKAVMQAMQSDGKCRLFAYVDHLNYRSIRGVRKSGYRIIGTLEGIRRAGALRFALKVEDQAWARRVRVGPIQHENL